MDYDESFSPVVKLATIRIMPSLVASNGWDLDVNGSEFIRLGWRFVWGVRPRTD